MGKTITKAFLMHKDVIVARLDIPDSANIKLEYINSSEKAHIPLSGLTNHTLGCRKWWNTRAINPNRPGSKTILEKLGYSSTNNMLVNNLALGLSDCYWIKPYDSDVRWADVNLFKNDFVDYFGTLSFNPNKPIDNITLLSPSATNGITPKKWVIDPSGKRHLIKHDEYEECQQALNEVFASHINELQGFDNYVKYNRIQLNIPKATFGVGCTCECFCDENTELITARDILKSMGFSRPLDPLSSIKKRVVSMGLDSEQFDRQMDYQIMFDFLISNVDRNTGNFGFLRDADTLKIKGMAPIYDNGSSMLLEKHSYFQFNPNIVLSINGLEPTERLMLKHVKDRSVLDLNKLSSVNFDAYTVYDKFPHYKINTLKDVFYRKLDLLDRFQHGKDIWKKDSKKTFFNIPFGKPRKQNPDVPENIIPKRNNIMDTEAGKNALKTAKKNSPKDISDLSNNEWNYFK